MTKSTITKKLLTKRNIFLLGLSTIAGFVIIFLPLLVFLFFEQKNPQINLINNVKQISFMSIFYHFFNADSDYYDLSN
ncbi:hypothetical protein, partial [Mesomycoplasma ovipneumoniae]|uniref:hypothetical protein n=1 Tax=Mesomycoplasma ovipneumoniae TaxID=29562 RepID=UPI00308068C8